MQIPTHLYDAQSAREVLSRAAGRSFWRRRQRLLHRCAIGAHGSQPGALRPDELGVENLARSFADPEQVGKNKAVALARRLRSLVPPDRHIRATSIDPGRLSRRQLCEEIRDVAVVLNSTGNRAFGVDINLACRDMAIPMATPGMSREGDPLIADLHLARWDRQPLTAGCLECLRPFRPGQPTTLDAQRATAAEVISVASITALAIVGILVPDSIYGRWIDLQAANGATYHIIHRWPLRVQPVRNPRRPGCQVCVSEQAFVQRVDRFSALRQTPNFIRRLAENNR